MKKYRVHVAERAKSDLRLNRAHIARDKPKAASNWLREVRQKIRSLSQLPFRCEIIPEAENFEKEYRHVLFGNYRIIYRVEGNTVFVVRVLHAARILQRSLLEE